MALADLVVVVNHGRIEQSRQRTRRSSARAHAGSAWPVQSARAQRESRTPAGKVAVQRRTVARPGSRRAASLPVTVHRRRVPSGSQVRSAAAGAFGSAGAPRRHRRRITGTRRVDRRCPTPVPYATLGPASASRCRPAGEIRACRNNVGLTRRRDPHDLDRRQILKATAATAGIAGFPLRARAGRSPCAGHGGEPGQGDRRQVRGTPASRSQYVAVTTDDVTKRAVTAPNSFDLIDTEYFAEETSSPTGNPARASTPSASRTPTRSTRCSPRRGGGKKVGDQGTAPQEGDAPKATKTFPPRPRSS